MAFCSETLQAPSSAALVWSITAGSRLALVVLLHGVSLHRTSTQTTDCMLLLHQSHSGGAGGVAMASQKG